MSGFSMKTSALSRWHTGNAPSEGERRVKMATLPGFSESMACLKPSKPMNWRSAGTVHFFGALVFNRLEAVVELRLGDIGHGHELESGPETASALAAGQCRRPPAADEGDLNRVIVVRVDEGILTPATRRPRLRF